MHALGCGGWFRDPTTQTLKVAAFYHNQRLELPSTIRQWENHAPERPVEQRDVHDGILARQQVFVEAVRAWRAVRQVLHKSKRPPWLVLLDRSSGQVRGHGVKSQIATSSASHLQGLMHEFQLGCARRLFTPERCVRVVSARVFVLVGAAEGPATLVRERVGDGGDARRVDELW